jgi:hypothetical protein
MVTNSFSHFLKKSISVSLGLSGNKLWVKLVNKVLSRMHTSLLPTQEHFFTPKKPFQESANEKLCLFLNLS